MTNDSDAFRQSVGNPFLGTLSEAAGFMFRFWLMAMNPLSYIPYMESPKTKDPA